MKSATPGPSTSPAEVTNVSPHGFWLFIGERELFVPFNQFPWFREASVREITNVQLPSPHHLHWPDLDIDLAVDSIEHPEKYPLVSLVKTGPLQDEGRPSAIQGTCCYGSFRSSGAPVPDEPTNSFFPSLNVMSRPLARFVPSLD